MTPELTYFIKVNLALVLLYGFYRLFFHKDTYFKLHRLVLLSFFVLAFSYPLFNIQEWVKGQEPIVEVMYIYSAMLPEVVVEEGRTVSWTQLFANFAFGIYLVVMFALLIRFLIQLVSIFRIARQSKRAVIKDIPVYQLPKQANPFSFFRMIFIYPFAHSENEIDEILTHEHTHVSQWHSVDVILAELITIICWVNPFIWLLKREVRYNLEYLADNKVVHAGYDSKAYQFHLLGLAHYQTSASLFNNFNVLDIRNRIIMMNKKRSSKMGRTKYLVFLPLAALLMLFSNIETMARITKEITTDLQAIATPVTVKGTVVDAMNKPIVSATVVVKGGNTGTITDQQGNFTLETESNAVLTISHISYNTGERSVSSIRSNPKIILYANPKRNDQVFTVVEEMPEFPGGQAAMLKYISENVKYPKEAQEKGLQGRVIASFVVEKDGSISSIAVNRGIDPLLDEEALRVINTFPKWKPGKQRGMAVPVKYTIPVTFRLFPSKADTSTDTGSKDEKRTISSKHGEVYTVIDEMPEFPGGQAALLEFIAKGIKYPMDAQKSGIQGRVVASFIILKDGSIVDVTVVREVYPSLDEEAVRVLGTMPKWTPGKNDGKPVNVKYTVPITFRLQ